MSEQMTSAGNVGTVPHDGATRAIDAAVGRALELMGAQADQALLVLDEALRASPEHPMALLVKGIALRTLHQPAAAVATLRTLLTHQPRAALAHYELGLALAALGQGEAAVSSLQQALQINPDIPGAWRTLADHLTAMGDSAGADAARARHLAAAIRDPNLLRAGAALASNDIPVAEGLLREYLKRHPTDVAALRMLAEVAARIGRYGDAEALLLRCLELAPGFCEARAHYATVLNRQNRNPEALAQLGGLLAADPRNPNHRNLKASILVAIGEFHEAAALYADLTAEYPQKAKLWLSYGHVLKTTGRVDEATAAFHRCLAIAPTFSDAWFTLANLKTYRFVDAQIRRMEAVLSADAASIDDRVHLNFALGKAYEDRAEYAKSFAHYAAGNKLRRGQVGYRAEDTTGLVERSRQTYTRELCRRHAGSGAAAPDPIFVVGLPRAGSTLVDQILSSHSQIEGTMELYDMIDLAWGLEAAGQEREPGRYPEIVGRLEPHELRAIGEQYLARTRVQRKQGAPLFIDKMPNNCLHVGLIALALPNAKIIDVRRHPLAGCFSVFKQHFARGQHFSYDLEEVGRYYRDYVSLMDHFDCVLPGRIHRVRYEALVEDTEAEVRALLAYCGVPFEERCLRFFENSRAVRTPSSEQVRQPIFRDGLEQWRHYEPWLEPLKGALGSLATAPPIAPR